MLTIMVKTLACAAIGIAAFLSLSEARAAESSLTRTQVVQHLTFRAFRRNFPHLVIEQTAAAETILHRFSGSPADGNNPAGGLNGDAAGALYGVTDYGGSCAYNAGGCGGTLFEVAPSTKGYYERFVYSFPATKTDAVSPFGAPIVDSSGRLFGSSDSGGAHGYGAVYEFTPSGSGFTERVVYSFKGGTDGSASGGALTFGAAESIYGTTSGGGGGNCKGGSFTGCGTIFKLVPSGSGYAEQVLYRFKGSSGDGMFPNGKLIVASNGAIYGVAQYGGAGNCTLVSVHYGCGTVFKLTPSGSTYTFKLVRSFLGGSDGSVPAFGLVVDKTGALYGATEYGGNTTACKAGYFPAGCGTYFKLTPSGASYSERVILAFNQAQFTNSSPFIDATGTIFGEDSTGNGSVFELAPSGASYVKNILYTFNGTTNGYGPSGGVIEDKAGALYGVTSSGGDSMCGQQYTCGIVYKLTH